MWGLLPPGWSAAFNRQCLSCLTCLLCSLQMLCVPPATKRTRHGWRQGAIDRKNQVFCLIVRGPTVARFRAQITQELKGGFPICFSGRFQVLWEILAGCGQALYFDGQSQTDDYIPWRTCAVGSRAGFD